MHINFWFLEDIVGVEKKVKTPYIDVGLKIKNYKNIEGLTFHCPFKLIEDNILDLSQKLGVKANSTMVFNDDCEISTINSYTCVRFTDKTELLIFLMNQAIENTYHVEQLEGKSNIIFDFADFHKYVGTNNDLKKFDDLYLRFRIKDVELKDKIYFDSEPINKSFESAFSGTRILDFKINEKRNIDNVFQTRMIVEDKKMAEFSKVHFLVMEPSSYELSSFSNYDMSCRELEEGMWDDYLDTKIDFSKGHVLAYHWKASAKSEETLKDFSCFAKINYSTARIGTIISYIGMVIALGVWGSAIVSFTPLLLGTKNYTVMCAIIDFVGALILFFVIFVLNTNKKE